jgi:hypothetical protein
MGRRSDRKKSFNGLTVRWVVPRHDSDSYQKYLCITWERFLGDIERRMRMFTRIRTPRRVLTAPAWDLAFPGRRDKRSQKQERL